MPMDTPIGGNFSDFTRARELTDEVDAAVDDAFEYHNWDEKKIAAGRQVCGVLAGAVKVIISCVPPGPDRSAAIRKIREARMDCNSAITHNGIKATLTGAQQEKFDQGRRVFLEREPSSDDTSA